jgi:hypothetical protein
MKLLDAGGHANVFPVVEPRLTQDSLKIYWTSFWRARY